MDLGVFWGFDSLCLWIYAAAGDHASPGWRFITITDKDTWTFSKSWKRMARFQSLQPFCHDCKNSLIHPVFNSSFYFFYSSNTPHTPCTSILRPNVHGKPARSREGGLGMGSGSPLRWRRPTVHYQSCLWDSWERGVEVWWQLQEEAGCVLRALSCAGWGQQGEGPAHIGILKGWFILFL